MGMVALKCPACGADIQLDENREFGFCNYCGTKVMQEKIVVEHKGTIIIDETEKINNLYKLARRQIQMNDYVKAKEYYDQILIINPEDWEASFFSIIGKVYLSTKGQVPVLVVELSNKIPVVINLAVASTDEPAKRRDYLDSIVTHTVKAYKTLYDNKVYSSNIEETRSFDRLIVNGLSEIGYLISDIGNTGKLGESAEYNKIIAKALRWRTELALKAVMVFDQEKRKKYADELAAVDPDYKKPEINKSPACYVATAVYGSYDCPQVWTLRRYRDYSLALTWYGRLFIALYYTISPTIVKWFGNTKWFNKMWKGRLDKMVKRLQEEGFENTPYDDKNW